MKMFVRFVLACASLLAALPASAALSCSITVTAVNVVYNYFPTVTGQGTLGVACTRNPGDARKPTIWIGMDQTTAGSTATLDTGGSTLTYEVYHANTTSGTWTNTGGVDNTSTTNAAVRERLDFGNRGGTSVTLSLPFYFSIPQIQIKPAGVYVDTLPITLRADSATGAVITTAALDVHISIPRSCRFSTPPSAISVTYPAFSPTPVTATSNFAITCTLTTTYRIDLDQTRSVVPTVGLAYSLSLATTSATGTAVAQPYTVNISVDAGQAGTCSTSTCSGTDSRTLTVTY